MSELRQIVPSESTVLERVVTFRSLPQCYDVFDIHGDGSPEVMGVQYYLAYKNRDHTPIKSYVTNRREPFYRWLYGDNIEMAEVGKARLKEVPVCRFIGRKAQEAETLTDVPLYEADVRARADPVLPHQARRLRQQRGLRAQSRAAQGGRRAYRRPRQAVC